MAIKDTEMTKRLREELYRLGKTQGRIADVLDCDRQLVYQWVSGRAAPSAYFLASICEAGCDIIYILTGKRTGGDRADERDG